MLGMLGAACLLAGNPPGAAADGRAISTNTFSYAWDVGYGNAVYLIGNSPELGEWDVLRAVKLRWTDGNNWVGQVALPAGTGAEYKFISRSQAVTQWSNSANVVWMDGANLQTNIPAWPVTAPYAGKTVYYYSTWTNAALLYASGTNWLGADMQRIGDVGGLHLYRLDGIGTAGAGLLFVPNGYTAAGAHEWDNSPCTWNGENNYYTKMDVFCLKNGQIYNYEPPAAATAGQVVTQWIGSSVASIPSRNIRVYLPRNYATNTWKRYPVVYFHDGQNVFQPGGTYGCWNAETAAEQEISQGRMRESILVAVDNDGVNRMYEYLPPEELLGRGGDYLKFLVADVKSAVDAAYRTLTDRTQSAVIGSSMGGLISAYIGYETNVFARLGIFSPAFTYAPTYFAQLKSDTRREVRIYMDWGTAENDGYIGNYWDLPWDMYDAFLAQGYGFGSELLTVVGCGHAHSEWAWTLRLPAAYRYLLDPADEANRLAGGEHPVDVEMAATNGAPAVPVLAFTGLAHWQYVLQSAASLVAPDWQTRSAAVVVAAPWARSELTPTGTVTEALNFYRLLATPAQ